MSVAKDIVATYRRPGQVMARLLSGAPREDRALAVLMGACVLMFIAQLPKLARQAHVTGEELNMLLGGSLMGLVFLAPLMFYAIAFVTFLLGKVARRKSTAWQARMALFWALLASSPLILLHGLVAGFVGPGVQMTLVGALWFGVFMWFWLSGLWQAQKMVAV